MITCLMQQKIGATIHFSWASHWENTCDGMSHI
jgi:hypothetical protein